MSTRLHIVLADDLVEAIDAARGLVPRAAWIRRACQRDLDRALVAAKALDRVDPVIEAKRRLESDRDPEFRPLPLIAPRRPPAGP